MRICCIGDSNTFGFDPRFPAGGRYHHDVSWAGRLEAAGHAVANYGWNGLPVCRSLHSQFGRLLAGEGQFDLVTVMLGTNDVLLGSSADEIVRSMERFIIELKEQVAKRRTRILLIAPPPLAPGHWVEGEEPILRSQALAAGYRAVAERQGVSFADAGLWGIPLAYDGVHFTEDGHRVFAEKLIEYLNRL